MADISKLKLPNNQTYSLKDSAAVKAVTWDTTNKKLTKTINGTTTNVVTGETILNGITSNQITTGLGYTPPHQPMGTASGNIANFEAAGLPLSKLRVAITAQQDLRGYDYPWVGGSGKNKFDSDTVLSAFTKNNNKYVGKPSYVVDDYVISGGFKTNTRYTLSYKAYNNTSTPSNFRFIFSYTDGTEEIIGGFVDTTTEKVIVGTSAENKTISKIKRNYGNGVELTLYDIQLEEGSTATTFAPYSNICPISGWDEVNVSVCGKNLVNISDKTMTSSGYVFVISGLNIRKGIYTFSAKTTTSASMSIAVYGNGVAFINTGFNGKSISFTATDTITDIRLYTSGAGTYEEMMLEIGSTSTTYEPYNGQTITIDLDGTRYGGTLDVVSGELVVDRAYVDLGTLNWTYSSETNRERFSAVLSGVKWVSDSIPINAICSALVVTDFYTVYSHITDNAIGMWNGSTLAVYSSAYTDVASFKQAMSGVQLVYELATPTTFYTQPTSIKSLDGENNIFASTGDVSVTYVTQEYDGLTANYASEAGGITQTPTTSSDTNEYPLLLKYSNNGSEEANIVKTTRDTRFTYKPSANTLDASYYNGNTLVRKTIYGSAGIRTQGQDSYNRNVNSEYLQEGFNVKYSASLSGGDLTDAGVTCRIDDCGGVDQYQPQIDIYNTRYASASQDSGVSKEGVIDHESIKVYEDRFNDNYASLSSQYKGFQADKDNIYLIHQEWSQGSATPTINEVMQIGIDDITLTGNTWDGAHTSLKDAIGAKVSKSGGTLTGALNFANNTWNNIGDDIKFGDINYAGTVAFKGISGDTTVRLNEKDNDKKYIYLKLNSSEGNAYIQTSQKLRIKSDGDIEFFTDGSVTTYNKAGNGYKSMRASAFTVMSSKLVKSNIKDITKEKAEKILELRPVTFDMWHGENNQSGMIAEEVLKVLPELVIVPENYNEEEAKAKIENDELVDVPSLDYTKFVPYLIRMVQEQQKEIDELKSIIND